MLSSFLSLAIIIRTDCKQRSLVGSELVGEARLQGGKKDIFWIGYVESPSFRDNNTRNMIHFVPQAGTSEWWKRRAKMTKIQSNDLIY